MLKDIRFCTCRSFDAADDVPMNQCITFAFTERAQNILSAELLERIATDLRTVESAKQGFPVGTDAQGNPRFARIRRLDQNLWRLPTRYLDAFIRFLFQYLPAEPVPGNGSGKGRHECDCSTP